MQDLLSPEKTQDYLSSLNAHYKAVRERLNGPAPKPAVMVKKVVFVEPPLPPPPPVEPEDEVEDLSLTRGMVMGSIETRREMNKVLKKHSMSWQEMMQHQRSQKFIDARADVYLFLHDIGWSLTKIGRICGGRDHTTILHNLRRAIKARLTDEDAVGLAAMGGNLIQYYDWKRSQSND